MFDVSHYPAVALVRREFLALLRLNRSLLMVSAAVAGAVGYVVATIGFLGVERSGADLSNSLLTAFNLALGFVGLILLPLLAALSISGERQRGTWDILRASPVSPAGLVVGKITSLSLFLAVTAVTLLPVMGVVFFFVGVDVEEFVIMAGGIILFSTYTIAMGVLCSTTTDLPTTAIVRTILATIGTGVFVAPLLGGVWGVTVSTSIIGGIIFTIPVHTGVLACVVVIACAFLQSEPTQSATVGAAFKHKAKKDSMEVTLYQRVDVTVPAMRFMIMGSVGFFAAMGIISNYERGVGTARELAHYCAVLYFYVVPAIAARSLARDYEVGTMDLMRMTLLKPREILWRQLRGARAWLQVLLGAPLAGVVTLIFMANGRAEALELGAVFLALAASATVSMLLSICGALLVRHTGIALLTAYAALFLPFFLLPSTVRLLFWGVYRPLFDGNLKFEGVSILLCCGAVVLLYGAAVLILRARHLRAR